MDIMHTVGWNLGMVKPQADHRCRVLGSNEIHSYILTPTNVIHLPQDVASFFATTAMSLAPHGANATTLSNHFVC